MNARSVFTRARSRRCWLAAASLAGSALIAFQSFQAADASSAAATYSHGVLRVTIPYQLPHAGAGRLVVETLTPEDSVLGSVEREVPGVARGEWREEIPIAAEPPIEDLAWDRVRWRFTYSGGQSPVAEGTDSISEILRTPVVRVFGQQSYLSGGEAAVRVVVTDSKDAAIAGPASLRVELAPPGKSVQTLFSGRLNRRGTAEAQFRIPAGLNGSVPLRYVVDTPIGSTEYVQQARVEDKVSILLTTEKPIYQPGQTIHARALSLDRANHEAAADRNLMFEVEDSRGNKVFRLAARTDRFGVASAEFALADEVNLGTYHLRAWMDGPGGAKNSGELALNVQKYVLPKFKVAVDLGGPESKAKRGYRPGDRVTGTVRANYFFGKSVDNAEVTIKATGMDVEMFAAGRADGKTDSDGAYRFDFSLPRYFAGRPLSQGAARVLIEATVKDSAGHSETRGEPIMVSESPLLITAVPEGGAMAPGLENQVFILAAYSDGTPARAELTIHAPGADRSAMTDESGVAVVPLRLDRGAMLRVDAKDSEGNRATASVDLQSRAGGDSILLRANRAVYRAGDRIDLTVLSTKKTGAAYIDVIREGQTVLTRDVDLVNGQAELSLTASPDLAGAIDFNAYMFTGGATPVADHRLAFVQPADELKIEATADRAEYKPGGDARIRFRVTNSKGQGVEAALGLEVVDEAVFALAEKQPGFAKVFFYLEQEIMKPRYEIHSLEMPAVLTTARAGQIQPTERAAQALFAATEMAAPNRFETQFGGPVPRTKFNEYRARYQSRFQAQLQEIADKLNQVYAGNPNAGEVPSVIAILAAGGAPGMRDAWGSNIQTMRTPYYSPYANGQTYTVTSAGPDKRIGTPDDLIGYMRFAPGSAGAQMNGAGPGEERSQLTLERNVGPMNGLAEIAGTILDPAGASIPNVRVQARQTSTGAVRSTTGNAEGRFSFAAVAPGEYDVTVTATAGFRTFTKRLAVQERDRANLRVYLALGALTEEVYVTAAATPVQTMATFGALDINGGGVAGGARRNFTVDGIAPIQTASSENSKLVDRSQMANITMKGRDLFGVLQTVPGVSFGNNLLDAKAGASADASAAAPPHVRSYFPEALYIHPEIITDANGMASISIPLADSITTWRMAMVASTPHGALGSGASSIKVFQDFFIEPDLPVTLTQGDQVTIPVAVYNYSGSKGDVRVQLETGDWFSLAGGAASENVNVESGRVGAAQFTIEAKRIGKFKLTLNAAMNGAERADIVIREIEVVPNGREQNVVFNGRLEKSVEHAVNFPAAAVPEAGKIFVRLYPGPLSQVIEGMDTLLRMPYGCFEQTSSATYPNVLALDYMKRTGKLTPEVRAKAEGFISNGYQRLLTFEVPGGGYSWFGQAPANKILTAYGLMEFYDMSQVHDVDANVIRRTQQWLASQQQADGSWRPDTQFINEGATNRFNSGDVRIAAYLGWALEDTGYRGPAVERAKQFVQQRLSASQDAYTLAVAANFAADGADRGFTDEAMRRLLDARKEQGDQAWWTAEETGVYGRGASAAVETTALAAQALLKWGQESGAAARAMNYIAAKKDAAGAWGTTQATVMALRALLLSASKSVADVRGTAEIALDGRTVQTLRLTPENNDLLHQYVFPADGSHSVAVRFNGTGALAYQVVGRYFLPWNERPANEPLSIDVQYDRTRLAENDVARATATVRNNQAGAARMVMVDLGIPPGFDLLSEDLQEYQEKSAKYASGRLEKFSLTATQAILYFDAIGAGDTLKLSYRLRAKYPIRARTFPSVAYEYYSPEVRSVARPVQVVVGKK